MGISSCEISRPDVLRSRERCRHTLEIPREAEAASGDREPLVGDSGLPCSAFSAHGTLPPPAILIQVETGFRPVWQ